jgi:hypothetical protein
MDNNYVNNLHARIDNILSDVYFGAPNAIPNRKITTNMTNNDSGTNFILWIILGLVLGVIICYFSMFYLEEDNEINNNKK